MAINYFSYTPALFYRGKAAPNLITRAKLPTSVLQNRRLFHPYSIEDGDRPDTIAYFYYGSEYYDWIVMLSNDMTSIRDQWPLTQDELYDHVAVLYGSLQLANHTTSYYILDTSLPSISDSSYQTLAPNLLKYYVGFNAVTKTHSVRQDPITLSVASFANLPSNEIPFWTTVSQFDDEFKKNEAKRNIFLIDTLYVADIEASLKKAFSA
jgi:hypothetical protein